NIFWYKIYNFTKLSSIIKKTSVLIKICRFFINLNILVFSADIFCLELIRNTDIYLIIIDLSGLISILENKKNIKLIYNLIDLYLKNL
ncbi:hypothetical protein BO71DRAFT_336098, partial [Aspergillus ellipticus CBS 707.79]